MLLFADTQASVIGGGVAGVFITIILGLVKAYKMWSERRTKQREEETEIAKKVIEVKKMARKAVDEEWYELFEARKRIHQEDVKRLEGQIKKSDEKVGELDKRERQCQIDMAVLQNQNTNQQIQLDALKTEKENLKKEMRELRASLRECGVPIPPTTSDSADKDPPKRT